MINIIITGGAGFIGSYVVRLFVNKYPKYHFINVDVLTYAGNLDNLSDIDQAPNYSFERVDIVDVIEERQGLKVGCIEEIAYKQGFFDAAQLEQIAQPLVKSGYGTYLLKLI